MRRIRFFVVLIYNRFVLPIYCYHLWSCPSVPSLRFSPMFETFNCAFPLLFQIFKTLFNWNCFFTLCDRMSFSETLWEYEPIPKRRLSIESKLSIIGLHSRHLGSRKFLSSELEWLTNWSSTVRLYRRADIQQSINHWLNFSWRQINEKHTCFKTLCFECAIWI